MEIVKRYGLSELADEHSMIGKLTQEYNAG